MTLLVLDLFSETTVSNDGTAQLRWIGLTSMGISMFKNLQKFLSTSGTPAPVYTNRTLSLGVTLKSLGGTPAGSASEVAKTSDKLLDSSSMYGTNRQQVCLDFCTDLCKQLNAVGNQ